MPIIDQYLHRYFSDNIREQSSQEIMDFAAHNWDYSMLGLKERHRITKLRLIIERHEKAERHERQRLRRFWREVEQDATRSQNKSPICPLCRTGIRTDNDVMEHIVSTPCGHLFHRYCIAEQITKSGNRPNARKCAVCRGGSVDNVHPIYLQYEENPAEDAEATENDDN